MSDTISTNLVGESSELQSFLNNLSNELNAFDNHLCRVRLCCDNLQKLPITNACTGDECENPNDGLLDKLNNELHKLKLLNKNLVDYSKHLENIIGN